MTLTKAALAALQDSIEHWKRLSTNTAQPGETPTVYHCALCDEFWNKDCKGCPVFKTTGQIYCSGSPYRAAYELYKKTSTTNSQRYSLRRQMWN